MKTAMMVLTSILFACGAQADMTYNFSESVSGVTLSYSGSLNAGALSFQGGLSSGARYIDIYGQVTPGQQIIEFQNMQDSRHPSYAGSSFRYSAYDISFDLNMNFDQRRYYPDDTSGDTFGFYIFEQLGVYKTWMNLPYSYVSGDAITGEMVFEGETLAAMGLDDDEWFEVYLPGDQMIRGQVIPEPASAAMIGIVGGLGVLIRRRFLI